MSGTVLRIRNNGADMALFGIGPRIEVSLWPHMPVDANAELFGVLADVHRDAKLVGNRLGFVDGAVYPPCPVAGAVDKN
jgi:hypothetical protein